MESWKLRGVDEGGENPFFLTQNNTTWFCSTLARITTDYVCCYKDWPSVSGVWCHVSCCPSTWPIIRKHTRLAGIFQLFVQYKKEIFFQKIYLLQRIFTSESAWTKKKRQHLITEMQLWQKSFSSDYIIICSPPKQTFPHEEANSIFQDRLWCWTLSHLPPPLHTNPQNWPGHPLNIIILLHISSIFGQEVILFHNPLKSASWPNPLWKFAQLKTFCHINAVKFQLYLHWKAKAWVRQPGLIYICVCTKLRALQIRHCRIPVLNSYLKVLHLTLGFDFLTSFSIAFSRVSSIVGFLIQSLLIARPLSPLDEEDQDKLPRNQVPCQIGEETRPNWASKVRDMNMSTIIMSGRCCVAIIGGEKKMALKNKDFLLRTTDRGVLRGPRGPKNTTSMNDQVSKLQYFSF